MKTKNFLMLVAEWYFINGLEDQTDLDGFKGILK